MDLVQGLDNFIVKTENQSGIGTFWNQGVVDKNNARKQWKPTGMIKEVFTHVAYPHGKNGGFILINQLVQVFFVGKDNFFYNDRVKQFFLN